MGEFGLIRRLTKDIECRQSSTLKGVGDDCAVIAPTDGEVTLVTTDLLMEGVHFDLIYTPLKHLGYKAVVVNLSDLYAMNATPRQLTVSLAIGKRFQVEDIDALYEGMRLACEKYGVDIVGGDTTASMTGLAISITAVGTARREDIVYRGGAKETDLICVSGNLGAAYMGLQLLEREKAVYLSQVDKFTSKQVDKSDENTSNNSSTRQLVNSLTPNDFQPDFAGREYLLERQLKPEPRKDILEQLRQAGIRPTSMMDISDGLSSELLHICHESQCGCRIYEERIPLDYQTAVAAEEFNMNVTTCALNGGEDYELLFTVPLSDREKAEALEDVKVIGYISKPDQGKILVTRDGAEFDLKAQGWNPM